MQTFDECKQYLENVNNESIFDKQWSKGFICGLNMAGEINFTVYSDLNAWIDEQ